MKALRRRIEKLEQVAKCGHADEGLITLAWYKAHADHVPIEEWPCSPEERAAIRARVDQVEETMRLFEATEEHHVEQ